MNSLPQQKRSRKYANNVIFINATTKRNNQKILKYEFLKQSAEQSV